MDLNKIKSKIDERKKEMIKESVSLGENVNLIKPAKTDTILYEIQQSLKTGQSNDVVDKIKAVDRLAAVKRLNKNGTSNDGLSEELMQHVEINSPKQSLNSSPQSVQQTISNINKKQQPVNINSNNQGLTEILKQGEYDNSYLQQTYQPSTQQKQQLSSNLINEQVNSTVNNYLNENFGNVVQKVMKDTVIEMYSLEKVKQSLFENKDYIKEIIRETLIELAKEKAKKEKVKMNK